MNTYRVMMLMPRLAAAGGSPRARGSRPQYAARRHRSGWARRHDENMALQLAPEEPEAGPWRVELLSTVVNAVTRRRPDQSSSGRPAVLAIDGRSNNGKTTLAARISELVPGSAVICTDDIAWEHSRFGWAGLLMDGVLVPVHHGQAVSYRPPRWDSRGREGSLRGPGRVPAADHRRGRSRAPGGRAPDRHSDLGASRREGGGTARRRPGGRSPCGRPGQQGR